MAYMSIQQINAYHDPIHVAARARERMRRISRRAFEFERRKRGMPIFSLTALLLAGLLFYCDLTHINAPPIQDAAQFVLKN